MRAGAELAFMPAALEVASTPPAPIGRAILWLIMLLFMVALVWASLGRVDIVAIAQGRIIPSGHSKVIQPVELGSVSRIAVANGDSVHAGQILIELDTRAAEAEVQRLALSVGSAEEDLERSQILSEWATSPTAFDIQQAHGLDALGQEIGSAHEAQLAVLTEERRRIEAEIVTARQQVKKLEAILPIVTRRAADQKTLVDTQLLPEQQFLETEQTRLELRHDLLTQRRRVDELTLRFKELDARRHSIETEFRRELARDLEEAERRVNDTAEELKKARARLSGLTIVAPVDGRVENLGVHHAGAVVTPAEPLMSIVPIGDALEVEASLENKDIGFVRVGQSVEVKVDAFPFHEVRHD
jgi:hemolysin D